MDRRNRRKWRRFLSSPLVLAAAVMAVVLLARADLNIVGKSSESSARLTQAEGQLKSLQADQADLSAKVADLSTPAGIEAELRDKYHATAPGESVAVIVDGNASGTGSLEAAGTSTPAGGWWSSLLRMIGL